VHRNITRPQAVQASQHVLTFDCQRKAQLSAVNLLSRVRPVALAEHEQNLLHRRAPKPPFATGGFGQHRPNASSFWQFADTLPSSATLRVLTSARWTSQ